MIVVDSSAWIEYYRPSGAPEVQRAVAALVAEDRVAVNGIIQVEIVAFASGEDERTMLENDFGAFHWLELSQEDFDRACSIGFDLRRRGVTAPPTDLIIAASAIGAGAEVVHLDRHFGEIAQVSDLRERALRVS